MAQGGETAHTHWDGSGEFRVEGQLKHLLASTVMFDVDSVCMCLYVFVCVCMCLYVHVCVMGVDAGEE